MGESLLQLGDEPSCSKLSPTKIPSSRLAAPGSPRMAKDTKVIFENYAGDLTNEEKKKIFEKVKRSQVFSS